MLEIALVQALVTGILGLFPSAPSGVSAFLASITGQLPALIAAGADINAFIRTQLAIVQTMITAGRDPTQAEWDALDATMMAELTKLQGQVTAP